jgi:hypothetical protein
MRNAYKNFIGKPEGKRPLGRPRCLRITLKSVLGEDWEVVDCIHLAQDRGQWRVPVNTVRNHQEGLCSMDFVMQTSLYF